jgi:hypothetical protein
VAKRCGVCGEERDSIFTCDVVGQSRHARVELVGFPYLTCRHRHEKVYAYPDFGAELHEFVYYGPGLTLTRQERPLFSGPERCRVCEARIPSDAVEQDHEFISEPKLGSAPQFTLRYTLPAVVCPTCGAAQVRISRLRAIDPSQALVVAFDSAGIRPM